MSTEPPLKLTATPASSHLRAPLVIGVAASLVTLLGVATYSALTKEKPGRKVERMFVQRDEPLPNALSKDPPAEAPPVIPTAPVTPTATQEKTIIREVRQAPTQPKKPRVPSAAEIAYKEGLLASPLGTPDKGGSQQQRREYEPPQTLEIAAQNRGSEFTIDGTLHAPQSPHIIQAGTMIPAILQTGINSDLPGDVFAQVSHDVLDSITMQHVLIPAGATLQGRYQHEVSHGQRRMLVVWLRVMYRTGHWLPLDEMYGADTEGYAGISDKVDRHFGQIFGQALVLSAISAGTGIAQGGFRGDSFHDPYSPADATASALGRELGQAGRRSLQQGQDFKPTLQIRPGHPVTVVVNKDIGFSKVPNIQQEEEEMEYAIKTD